MTAFTKIKALCWKAETNRSLSPCNEPKVGDYRRTFDGGRGQLRPFAGNSWRSTQVDQAALQGHGGSLSAVSNSQLA